jgi:twitching motility two-component system response regulator PilH
MGFMQRLMRLFGQPAPVAGEEVIVPEPPFTEGIERRMKERKPSAPGIKVLIIDDSTTIVALLRRMMRQNDFETLEAGDAESGIELAKTEVPHLIFLDIVLPGMNGFNALRVLRRDALTRHIPIIMISGNEQATEEFYVHRIGADDFMKKPFARAEVFARIERLMDEAGTPRRVNVPAAEIG